MTSDHTGEFWNGELGERWVQNADSMDRVMAPIADLLIEVAELGEGEKVLDIGCGAGVTTMVAVSEVGETGGALGVDVSAPLVAHARKRASAASSSAKFELANAAEWRADELADVMISRFGVMFFEDPTAAFANIHANMAENGRLAFICWRTPRESELLSLGMMVSRPFLKEPPQPTEDGAPGPFAFADAGRVENILTQSGWRNIEITPVDLKLIPGEGDLENRARTLIDMGPMKALLDEQGVDVEQIYPKMTQALQERCNEAGVPELSAGVWVVKARA